MFRAAVMKFTAKAIKRRYKWKPARAANAAQGRFAGGAQAPNCGAVLDQVAKKAAMPRYFKQYSNPKADLR